MSNGIYFSANNDKEGFRLPINPETVKVSGSGDGEEYNIAKLGNINIPKDEKLKEYTIESFFPATESIYQVTDFIDPQFYINLIEKWIKNKMQVRYIYVDGSFTINELVTIEKFDYDETAGSADINFSLSLKQYASFGPKKMTVVKTTSSKKTAVKKSTPARQNQKQIPKTYTLVKGDSLWKVAQKFYGNGSRYKDIQKLNGIKDSQLRKLPIGLKIKLPAK